MRVDVLPPIRVATMRYSGPYGAAINQFWQTFNAKCVERGWIGEKFGIAVQGEQYVVAFDDPEKPEAQSCCYDAAVVVSAEATIDEPFCECVIPGGCYFICEFFGTPQTIGIAWEAAYAQLRSAGKALQDDRRPFEWYRTSDQFLEDGSFSCALCLPLNVG